MKLSQYSPDWRQEPKFDSHCHIYPAPALPAQLQSLKSKTRALAKPFTRATHSTFLGLRALPAALRKVTEEFGVALAASHLLIESTEEDRKEEVEEANIIGSLVVSHPPLISNKFTLEVCERNSTYIPALQFEGKGPISEFVGLMKKKKIKVLKIHPMAEGKGPKDKDYLDLLEAAEENNWIVVVHSGEVWAHLGFKKPGLGNIELFFDWFKDFPRVKFVAAHMNIHAPRALLDLDPFPDNLWVTLSWQNSASMNLAIQTLGADRLLFATDWPLLGGNGLLHAEKLHKAMTMNRLSSADREKIWRLNAFDLMDRKKK